MQSVENHTFIISLTFCVSRDRSSLHISYTWLRGAYPGWHWAGRLGTPCRQFITGLRLHWFVVNNLLKVYITQIKDKWTHWIAWIFHAFFQNIKDARFLSSNLRLNMEVLLIKYQKISSSYERAIQTFAVICSNKAFWPTISLIIYLRKCINSFRNGGQK